MTNRLQMSVYGPGCLVIRIHSRLIELDSRWGATDELLAVE